MNRKRRHGHDLLEVKLHLLKCEVSPFAPPPIFLSIPKRTSSTHYITQGLPGFPGFLSGQCLTAAARWVCPTILAHDQGRHLKSPRISLQAAGNREGAAKKLYTCHSFHLRLSCLRLSRRTSWPEPAPERFAYRRLRRPGCRQCHA